MSKATPLKKNTAKRTQAANRSASSAGVGNDWRIAVIARVRAIIGQADPDIVEAVKWRKPSNAMRGVPVWSHPKAGMICTGEIYKNAVKLTFARGAFLADPSGLFNASLEGRTRRAIDIHEGDELDEHGLVALVRAAAAWHAGSRGAAHASTSRNSPTPALSRAHRAGKKGKRI